MTEDEIFIKSAKAAIDKFPIISGSCQDCPIRFIESSLSKSRINRHIYLNKNVKHEGSMCFLIAQKMQQLKIAKVNGIYFNMLNNGYIGCANSGKQNTQKIKIIKFYDFNKI